MTEQEEKQIRNIQRNARDNALDAKQDTQNLGASVNRAAKFAGGSIFVLSIAVLLLAFVVFYMVGHAERKDSKEDCYQKYVNIASNAQSEYFVTLGQTLGTAYDENLGVATSADLATIREELRTDANEYQEAVRIRNEYDEAGRPLPCEI